MHRQQCAEVDTLSMGRDRLVTTNEILNDYRSLCERREDVCLQIVGASESSFRVHDLLLRNF